ncbi:MAG TPA: hypothetical protein VH092_38365 [Urbifossiella sp.]|jgi:hypothetical protein|nr:hypothetical protein [Urbifossiella sp.]
MPSIKVVFGFQQSVFGPSESYVSQSVSPTDYGAKVQKLLDARALLLNATDGVVGVRIGEASGVRRSNLYPPGSYTLLRDGIDLVVPASGKFAAPGADAPTDQARSCLQIRTQFDDSRHATRYLSLVPDVILRAEPGSFDLSASPKWQINFNLFRELLISEQWGTVANDHSAGNPQIAISGWVRSAAAPNLLGIKVPAAPPPGIVENKFLLVSGTRRRGDTRISYNGKYYVDSLNTTVLPGFVVAYLRGTEAGDPDSVKIPGFFRRVSPVPLPFQKYSPVRAGTHKRGRPFVTPVGRRVKRASLGL